MTEFDREVERELRHLLDPIMVGRVPPPPAAPRTGFMVKLLGGAGAAIAAKAVVGFAVLAVAAAGAGAVTEVAVTGSLNPANWGVRLAQHPVVVSAQHSAATSSAVPSTDSSVKAVEPGNSQPAASTPPTSPAPTQVNVAPKLSAPGGSPPQPGCGPSVRDLQSGC